MYFIILFYILFLSLFVKTNTDKQKKIFIFAIMIVLVLCAGFRGINVGTDTETYHRYYNNFLNYGYLKFVSIWKLEPGFLGLYWIISKTFNNVQAFFLIANALTSFAFGKLIYKYSDNIKLSCLIYFLFIFPRTMNISRMYCAISFIIFAFDFIVQKKIFKAFICICLAACFHYSAFILLPLSLIGCIKQLGKKQFSILIFIGIGIYVALPSMVFLFSLFLKKYAHYLTANPQYSANLSWKYALVYSVFIFLGIWVIRNKKNFFNQNSVNSYNIETVYKIPTCNLIRDSYLLSFVFFVWSLVFLLSASKIFIADRFYDYFYYSFVLFAPNTIEMAIRKNSRFVAYICIYAIFIFAGMNSILANVAGIFPYAFCF